MTPTVPSSTIKISSVLVSSPPSPAARWLTIEYLLYFGYAIFFFYQVFSISATRSEGKIKQFEHFTFHHFILFLFLFPRSPVLTRPFF
jgi:hypothetical protein